MTVRHIGVLLMAAFLMSACSTTRQERSAKAVSSLREVRELLAKGEGKVGDLQKEGGALQKAGPDNLRSAYDRFASAAKDLRNVAAETRGEAGAMRARATDYFSAWEKELGQINNVELRKMSRERQSLLNQDFGRIQRAMSSLEKAYVAYEKDLADVERFLGNDLTRMGSEMAGPYLAKLAEEASGVLGASKDVREAIASLEQVLAPR
jgi:hypothetical protein